MWTPPPVQPVVQSSAAPGPAMSFAAIQLSQAQQDIVPAKDKRSLREIQEEERARQEEEAFLRWWTAEEERLKAEELATAALLAGPTKRPKKQSRGAAKGRQNAGNANGPVLPGGDGQKGTRKDGARKPPKERERPPREQGQGQGQGQGQAQSESLGQSQGAKPRRRRPKDDARNPDAPAIVSPQT